MKNNKTMTAKEYLYRLWNLDREIEIKYRELEKLRAQVGIKAQPDPDQNVGHSGNTSDPVFDYVAKVTQMENQLNRKIDMMINLKKKITGQIDGMDNRTFRNILTCRYVLMMGWKEVADSCGYSTQHIYRMHGKALQEFTKLYLKR